MNVRSAGWKRVGVAGAAGLPRQPMLLLPLRFAARAPGASECKSSQMRQDQLCTTLSMKPWHLERLSTRTDGVHMSCSQRKASTIAPDPKEQPNAPGTQNLSCREFTGPSAISSPGCEAPTGQ